MNLRLYLFVFDVIGIKISFNYPRGLGPSPQSFRERGGVFSVCGVFVDD